MLPKEKAQRKKELLEKMCNGHVDDETLQEFIAINADEKKWESEREAELAKIASGILKYHISITELLTYQHAGQRLFDESQRASALELLEQQKEQAVAPQNKSQASAKKKVSAVDDELLLFTVRGAAGAPKNIRQGDALPTKFPASFIRAFKGQDKETIRQTLLKDCLFQGISDSAQTYLKSEQGEMQVVELVDYIYRELAQSANQAFAASESIQTP
ncbi:hypothetical protein [Lampropedia aestuarii]|uniref:hypothetical protein n=1 Tax=Lampropedia aestuarii TaxID=2562762 RepID=UPI00246926E5|nr:hypothetical protein [Lampropedia aestuarii]MDH5859278.1 hypothetical protein [Lampropedia aestuarii]